MVGSFLPMSLLFKTESLDSCPRLSISGETYNSTSNDDDSGGRTDSEDGETEPLYARRIVEDGGSKHVGRCRRSSRAAL